MDKITQSFAGLVKHNNGVFKSQKQADFLRSQADGDVYLSVFRAPYNNSTVEMRYILDHQGVVRVEKSTTKRPKPVVTWERASDEQHAADIELKQRRQAISVEINANRDRNFRLEQLKRKMVLHRGKRMLAVSKASADDVDAIMAVFRRWTALEQRLDAEIAELSQRMLELSNELDRCW